MQKQCKYLLFALVLALNLISSRAIALVYPYALGELKTTWNGYETAVVNGLIIAGPNYYNNSVPWLPPGVGITYWFVLVLETLPYGSTSNPPAVNDIIIVSSAGGLGQELPENHASLEVGHTAMIVYATKTTLMVGMARGANRMTSPPCPCISLELNNPDAIFPFGSQMPSTSGSGSGWEGGGGEIETHGEGKGIFQQVHPSGGF